MDVNSALVNQNPEVKFYSDQELMALDRLRIPEHVAIIMDGNRRWARRQGLAAIEGHWQGAEALSTVVRAASELGIKVLTVFSFSTENWKRSSLEVKALMTILKAFLVNKRDLMRREGISLNVIGDMTKFPEDVQKVLEETIKYTEGGERLDLVLALNYGGRDELKRAFLNIIDDCLSKQLTRDAISEELISQYLDTAKWKDPDMLIRTSGESRVSNFMLWQISYSELFVTDVLWPDFDEKDLLSALLEYQKRELRFGK